MSRTSRTSRLAVLLGAFVLAAGTAACSNNADATATATKASVDKGTIRIAYQAFPSGDLVVKDQKWLEKALPAYKIEWKQFDSGASINTAFVAGAIDVAAIGSSPVARGLSAPLNIPYKVAWILDVAGDNEALVARKDRASRTSPTSRARRSPRRSAPRPTTACWRRSTAPASTRHP